MAKLPPSRAKTKGLARGSDREGKTNSEDAHLARFSEHLQLALLFGLGHFAPPQGTSYDSQDLNFAQGGPGDENPLILKRGIGRDDAESGGLDEHEVIRDHAFERIAIAKEQTNPNAGSFGAGEKGAMLPPRLGCLEIANKTNGFCV